MKIAITADCHLTKSEDYPQRYQAFENILDQLLERWHRGSTEAGGRAASSHTGALASSDAAVDALFRKAGI